MSVVECVYRYKDSGLCTLTECTHKHLLFTVAADLERIAVGLRLVELVRLCTEERQSHEGIFELLEGSLLFLNRHENRTDNILHHFELALVSQLGFVPLVDRRQLDDLGTTDRGWLNLSDGSVSKARPESTGCVSGSRQALRTFGILANTDLATSEKMILDPGIRRESVSLVEQYVAFHIERSFPTRSSEIRAQLIETARTSPTGLDRG